MLSQYKPDAATVLPGPASGEKLEGGQLMSLFKNILLKLFNRLSAILYVGQKLDYRMCLSLSQLVWLDDCGTEFQFWAVHEELTL